jgi:succinate-acetate transporter protein
VYSIAESSILSVANPTPLGFVGFVISTFTFSMTLMGWGGASGLYPVVGIFFFVGPLLLTLACIFEWIMGNFFSMMVMGMYDFHISTIHSHVARKDSC